MNDQRCKDCKTEIFADINMVMLKDDLWENICDEHLDRICDICIEKRMGRAITEQDFKDSPFKGEKFMKCNRFWLERKERIHE